MIFTVVVPTTMLLLQAGPLGEILGPISPSTHAPFVILHVNGAGKLSPVIIANYGPTKTVWVAYVYIKLQLSLQHHCITDMLPAACQILASLCFTALI